MALDISNLEEFTAAEKVKAVDRAIVAILVGGQEVAYQDGRRLVRADLDKLRKLMAYYQQQAADEASTAGAGNNAVIVPTGGY